MKVGKLTVKTAQQHQTCGLHISHMARSNQTVYATQSLFDIMRSASLQSFLYPTDNYRIDSENRSLVWKE